MFQIANGSWLEVTARATPNSEFFRLNPPNCTLLSMTVNGARVAIAGSIRTARTPIIRISRPRNRSREKAYAARRPIVTLAAEMRTAMNRLFSASCTKDTGFAFGLAITAW